MRSVVARGPRSVLRALRPLLKLEIDPMTTPASPSPGTQLLSEEELENALWLTGSSVKDVATFWRDKVRAHIAALTASRDELQESFDANHSVHCMREQQRLQQEIETLTASREEMRGLLMEASDCISGPTLDTTLTQGLTLKLALWRAAQASALSQQPGGNPNG